MSLQASPSDVLLTFGEIAVAFAGFASIVAIFQRGAASGPRFDRFRFWVMLEFSLFALFFALLPFPLAFLGLDGAGLWLASSAALLGFLAIHVFLMARLVRSGAIDESLTPALSVVANAVYLAILVSQIWNLLQPGFGRYLLGLFLVLLGAGVNFARLVWVGQGALDGS